MSEPWLATGVSEGCPVSSSENTAWRGAQSDSKVTSGPQGKPGCPKASPIQKMKVTLRAEQALGEGSTWRLRSQILSCFTSGLGGSLLLFFIGVCAMPRGGEQNMSSVPV